MEVADTGTDSDSVGEKDAILLRHRNERKDLQAVIQKLKHDVKGDKRLKKEISTKIAMMEAELSSRHDAEITELQNNLSSIRMGLEANHDDNCGDVVVNSKVAKKQEKNKRKKERKEIEIQEREERIKQQDIENLQGERHKEQEKIKKKLADRGLQLYEIASDGNCLYKAVSHQMSLHSQCVQNKFNELRKVAADYMLQHRDEFLPFLIKPNSELPYTPDEYEAYCDNIISTSTWGGQPELRALSLVLHHPIHIIQADCDDIVIGEECRNSPLIVVYHRHVYSLGEHYNSVTSVVIGGEEEDFLTQR